MNPILKNILAVVVGVAAGMAINMIMLIIGGQIIPIPEGVDPMDGNSIKAAIEAGKFESKHYIFPFIAHAAHALIGAFVCTKMAANNSFILAMIVGVIVLISGVLNSMSLGTSMTTNLIDWVFAYIPMAWIGWRLAKS